MQSNTKLRTSCDNCLVAKVRCTKAKDGCARCVEYGAVCSYSPSLRGARPRMLAKQKNLIDTASKDSVAMDRRCTPDLSSDQQQLKGEPRMQWHQTNRSNLADQRREENFGDAFLMERRSSNEFLDFTDALTFDPMQVEEMTDRTQDSNEIDIWQSAATNDRPLSRANPQRDQGISLSLDGITESPESSAGDVFSSIQTSTTTATSSKRSSAGPSERDSLSTDLLRRPTCTLNPCDCFTDILEALCALHRYCKAPGTPLDVALQANKEAVERCRTMLGCPCARENSCVMLLSVIIGRILLLYRLASKGYFVSPSASQDGSGMQAREFARPQPSFASSQALGMLENRNRQHCFHASSIRLTLGSYKLDPQDERMINKNIIMIQVRKVQGLIRCLVGVMLATQDDAFASAYKALQDNLIKDVDSTVESISLYQ